MASHFPSYFTGFSAEGTTNHTTLAARPAKAQLLCLLRHKHCLWPGEETGGCARGMGTVTDSIFLVKPGPRDTSSKSPIFVDKAGFPATEPG